ncbi:hypothetical protein ACLB2K_050830 [Fragaria x ananassa]
MAGLFDKQAEIYVEARPTYPKEWYSKLAALTPQHSLAWDAGTGNGQAALGHSEHYQQVVATDISEEQLKYAIQHPRIRYMHTPTLLSEDEMFYSLAKRLLRKPGGIIAVWAYNRMLVNPEFDPVFDRFRENCIPFTHPNSKYVRAGYKTLPFPFESVGMGREGEPLTLEIPKEVSFQGVERMLRSYSAVIRAKDQGVDMLPEEVIKEFERAWGGSDLVRTFKYEAFMLVGKL